ncbi:DNA repair protein SWI5 homolog [Liolophura sinensis]|uniref:DNA repair protein SWI5 homolog n=1 Tax=Liolophura sinensis TaxID=3198878 RepID=UPI00315985B4
MANVRSFKTPKRRYRGNFKSPLPASHLASPVVTTQSMESLKETIKLLKAENKSLEEQIKQLQSEGYDESELSVHIDKLHQYNDIKDTGQMVLGRLANVEGVTTRTLYQKYGLNEED